VIFDGFSDDEKRVLLFIKVYEDCRREAGQKGYQALREWAHNLTEDVRKRAIFKQARTVVAWLEIEGWTVRWDDANWRGFIEHAFEELAPLCPHVGQLRNKKLLAGFIRGSRGEVGSADERSDEELQSLYAEVLRPEIADRGGIKARMGLI